MTVLELKIKSDDVNAKTCKSILLLAEEAAETGCYEIILDETTATENKRRYLRSLGFNTNKEYVDGSMKVKVSW